MAASFGGFNFGAPKTSATTASSTPGGFSFGSSGANKPTGLAIGTPAQQPAATGGFGSSTPQTGGLFGATASTAPATGGFSFGAAKPTLGGFGVAKPTLGGFGATAAATTTTSAATGFQLGGLKTTPASSGFSFGAAKPAATTQSGLTLGGTSGFKLGGLGATATTGASTGFGALGGATLGTGFGLGSTATSTATTTASKGLGGITLTSTTTATTSSSAKTSDNKALLDSEVPADICKDVNQFKDYVKKQKGFKDDIGSFSEKPIHAIREDTIALKQLLAVLDGTFQRNAAAIHRLKEESSQVLRDAEIAQRTNEIPAGLQTENYAPSQYFQRMVTEFEDQFQQYRHLIEQLEHQIAAIDQQASYTPRELSGVMVKLNETFIGLAAQLQGVHDLVKAQKEQYLTYRRVFHDESKDVFAARKKSVLDEMRIKSAPVGSRAFQGTSDALALAMIAALGRQQPAPGVGGAMNPTMGFGAATGGTTGSLGGFGTTGTTGFNTTGLNTTGLGASKGFGNSFGTGSSFGTGTSFGSGSTLGAGSTFGTGTGLFGKPTTQASTGLSFGSSLSAGPLGTSSTGLSFGNAATGSTFGTPSFGSTTTGKPLQLQKPPNKFRKGAR